MPEEEADLWHVAEGGKTHGPYTADMLQQRFDNGRFSNSALVWRDGLPSWQPISLHFTLGRADSSPPVEQMAQPTARVGLRPLLFVRWGLLAVTLLCFSLVSTGNAASNELGANSFLLIRLIVIGAMVLSGIAAAVVWWRHASAANVSDKAKGLVRAGVVVCSIVVAITAFAAAMNTPLLYRVQIA